MPALSTKSTSTTLHLDGIMPSANWFINKLCSQISEEEQVEYASLMVDFIAKQENMASLNNLDACLVPFLIDIQGSTHKVCVMYDTVTGFGPKGIH